MILALKTKRAKNPITGSTYYSMLLIDTGLKKADYYGIADTYNFSKNILKGYATLSNKDFNGIYKSLKDDNYKITEKY